MIDIQNIGIIVVAVAIVAIVLYVWDRKTKHEQIEWTSAGKIAAGAGAIAGGVVYAVGGEDMAETVVETAASAITATQDMFVGKPSF